MTPAESLVEQITATLNSGTANAALAADYSLACEKLNARLQQLREIIDNGDSMQALVMAETPPPVLEEANFLLFPRRAEWLALCAENGHRQPPEINAGAVQRINLLYGKGISSTHPLYKDLRTAVMARNNTEALRIARTIEKLNPSDQRAAKERSRLEGMVFVENEKSLASALAAQDEKAILAALHRLAEWGPQDSVAKSPHYQSASQVLAQVHAREAARTIEDELLPLLPKAKDAGNWQQAGEILARIDQLQATHGVMIGPAQMQLVTEVRQFADDGFQHAKRQQDFQKALVEITRHIDRIETILDTSHVSKLQELRSLHIELKRLWQVLDSFGFQVPAELIQNVSKQSAALESAIERAQRKIAITTAVAATVLLVAIGAGGWWILGAYNAGKTASEISNAIANRQPGVVENLLDHAQAKNLGRFSSRLVATMAEGRAFLDSAAASTTEAINQLTFLETLANKDFPNETATSIQSSFDQLKEQIGSLPEDQLPQLVERFNKLKSVVAKTVQERAATQYEELRTSLELLEASELHALAGSSESYKLQEFQDNLAMAAEKLDSIKPLLDSPNPSTSPPPDLVARAKNHTDLLQVLSQHHEKAEYAQRLLNKATSFEEFEKARSNLAATFRDTKTTPQEVKSAKDSSYLQTAPEELTASLLMPWSKKDFPVLLKNDYPPSLRPDTKLLDREDRYFGRILNDKNSQDIFTLGITTRDKKSKTIYAKGKLDTKIDSVGYKVVAAKVYDPVTSKDGSIFFLEKKFNQGSGLAQGSMDTITTNETASFTKMYRKMRAAQFLDGEGIPTARIWQLLDRASSVESLDPVYFAFLMQQISRLVEERRLEWGVPFAPTFLQSTNRLKTILRDNAVSSGSWMNDPELRRKLANTFTEPTTFDSEALLNKSLFDAVKRSPLVYAGYVGADGKPILFEESLASPQLWGLTRELQSTEASLVFNLEPDGTFSAKKQPIPYTPLFRFDGKRDEILKSAMKRASLTPETVASVIVPPLFADLIQQNP